MDQPGGIEEIARTLLSRAQEALPLGWQACFVREAPPLLQSSPGRWRLAAATGDAPAGIAELRSAAHRDSEESTTLVLPLEHAGSALGVWLVGSMPHSGGLASSQVHQLAELARPAAAALDAALLRAWARRPRNYARGVPNGPLTPREEEVAALIARGNTNGPLRDCWASDPGPSPNMSSTSRASWVYARERKLRHGL